MCYCILCVVLVTVIVVSVSERWFYSFLSIKLYTSIVIIYCKNINICL